MDGEPLPQLGGLTTLQYARTPALDALRECGSVRLLHTTPEGMTPGSEVAIVSLLGYDARQVALSRAPFEARALGYEMADDEMLMRCNLVGISPNGTIDSYDGRGISAADGREFIERLNSVIDTPGVKLIAAEGFRHLLSIKRGSRYICTPAAHDMVGCKIGHLRATACDHDPLEPGRMSAAETAEIINRLTARSARSGLGMWPWSPGYKPRISPLGIKGSVVTAVNVVRGIAMYAGLKVIDVAGATGRADTNYEGKVEAALAALRTDDFVMLHLEGPDTASHERNIEQKIKVIEDIDRMVIKPVVKALESWGETVELTVTPDHGTSALTGSHLPDPVQAIVTLFQATCA